MPDRAPDATQELHPWKTTVRTAFQLIVGLAAILPFIADDLGATAPWAVGVVGVAAAVTRVMALPQVEDFLEDHFPWLAAQ